VADLSVSVEQHLGKSQLMAPEPEPSTLSCAISENAKLVESLSRTLSPLAVSKTESLRLSQTTNAQKSSFGDLGGTNHSYFNELVVRPDIYVQQSLRNQAQINGLSDSSPNTHITYDPDFDTDPQRQDAAKLRIPAFGPNAAVLTAPLAASPGGTIEPIFISMNADLPTRRGIKFAGSDEIMVSMGDTSPLSINVMRGCFGTTPTTHPVGAQLQLCAHVLQKGMQILAPTDPLTDNCYLTTIDLMFTDSWKGMAVPGRSEGVYGNTAVQPSVLQSMKQWQWRPGSSGGRWWETRLRENGGGALTPDNWASLAAVRVGSIDARPYSVMKDPYRNSEQIQPIVSGGFTFRAGVWARYWWLMEMFAELNNMIATTTLDGAVDDTTTTVTLSQVGLSTTNNVLWSTDYVGRPFKVGTEVITITSTNNAVAPAPLICTVVRGAKGTARASHSNGDAVLMSWDYMTLWVADEVTDPVLIYDRVPLKMLYKNGAMIAMHQFDFEWNTSQNVMVQGRIDAGLIDLVAYVKNFAMLKKLGSTVPADWAALRVKPTPGGM
jgi:hypothetical protein